mgnify:CR=1 FL=1
MTDRALQDHAIPPDEIYATVLRKIREQACVLFLGPMATLARAREEDPWTPLAALCARHLAERFRLPESARADESLVHTASMLRLHNLCGEIDLQDETQQFFKNSRSYELHPFLERLAELPFPIVINTSPDDAFARLLRASARPVRQEFYNFYKSSGDLEYDAQTERRTLAYNLTGIYDPNPESMVLTYKHQLDFVKKITSNQHERLPESLSNAFKSRPYQLFLGFDFDDWSLRMILDNLFKNVRGAIRPIAYQPAGAPEVARTDQVFFRSEFGMLFPPAVGMEDFVENLYALYEQGDSGPTRQSAAPKAKALLIYDETNDQDGFLLVEKYLRPLNIQIITLRDALGAGDVGAWLLKMLDECQIIMPLVSVNLLDPQHPACTLLPEIARRNRPRKGLLVMPVVLRELNLADTPFAQLSTTRPLDAEALIGSGKESEYLTEISAALRDYVESLPDS